MTLPKIYTPEMVKGLPEFKRASKNIEREIDRLLKQKNNIDDMIKDLGKITEFCNGEPIQLLSNPSSVTIYNVPWKQKHAFIYHNATVPLSVDDWGLRFHDHGTNQFGLLQENFVGVGYTKEEALRIGKEWVVGGVLL